MKTKLLILITTALFLPVIGFSQLTDEQVENLIKENNIHKLIQANNDLIINENHILASKVARKLVENEPDNSNFNYRLGYSLIEVSPYVDEPIQYLEKAIKSITKNFDIASKNEKSAPVDAYFHYATTLLRSEKIAEARENFNRFLESVQKKSAYIKDAQLGITYCNNAEKQMNAPQQIEVSLMGEIINSSVREFAPIISFDGTYLFFTSTQPNKNTIKTKRNEQNINFLEDIYVTQQDNSVWNTPKILDFCKPDVNEATVSVSVDERKVYLYNNETGNGDIYYSQFKQGSFGEIKQLTIPNVNTKSWEPHLNVSPNGKLLFFVSDRPGGYGGRDIYYCVKNGEDSWSEPINAGPTINSEFDEDSPFIAYDNSTIYFSSNNDKSIGGFDIFKSKINSDFTFNPIENLGYPINSTADDIFFSTTADGIKSYISSFRKGGMGDLDIYEITMSTANNSTSILKGQISVVNKQALPEDVEVKVNCLNCEEATSISRFPRLKDGVYFVQLEKCKEYELIYTYSESKKEIQREQFKTTCSEDFEEIEKFLSIKIDGATVTAAKRYAFQGKVYNNETKKPIANAKISVKQSNGEIVETQNTNDEGVFQLKMVEQLQQGAKLNLELIIEQTGFITMNNVIQETLKEEENLNFEYALTKNEVGKDLGKVILLNTIYFDLNSSYLRKDAKKELDQVIIHLNLNPSIAIECGSHTDCREDSKYNQWLSERRALRTKEYIQKKISNPSRVTGVGYGESKLINNCGCDVVDNRCSEEQHQMNRRTEFIILSK